MKKIFIILILSFVFTNNVFAKAGKGEVYLSKEAMETFLDYLYGGAKNLNPNTGGGTRNKNLKSKPLLFTKDNPFGFLLFFHIILFFAAKVKHAVPPEYCWHPSIA